ncbi:unnamed protein product [Phytomonas sp. Hart1]|nr:unnamed protein product [Phytomonas sp. Hart1]|eukprot:CCW72268.1 unnamed protein product [Phytomonas sp. isolate Hart1]
MSDFRNEIQQLARAYQYRLHPFALKRLSDFLKELDCDRETSRSLLRDLFVLLKKKCIQDRFIDQLKVESVISTQMNLIKGAVDKVTTSSVQIVLPNHIPRLIVDETTGQVKPIQGVVEGNRLSVLRQRYLMAYHRCLRSGIYRTELKQRFVGEELLPLVPTTALEGIAPNLQIAVLGLIRKHGQNIILEDLNNQVELHRFQCSNLNLHHFICSGFFVVVIGFFNHGLLVKGISLPPPERRGLTRALFPPSVDYFGLAPSNLDHAIALEKSSCRSVILFLAHVFLDRPTTMTQLVYFFEKMQERGEQDLLETTFVFIGNFTSTPLSYGDVSHLFNATNGEETFQHLLENLATCIVSSAPTAAQHSQFVFIPGPTDLTALQGFLPQHPLTKSATKGLRSKLKKVILAPNPCRIRFFTHEIILSRRDYLRVFHDGERCFDWEKYRHNVGNDDAELQATSFERISKTLIDEGHLAPSLEESVLWKLDDALRLPVLPHTLILCDSTMEWECYYKDVHVVNPGSFSVNTTFLWYTPTDGECILSNLK